MEENLEPGDVVWLKSGSPPLTVNNDEGDDVQVVWFDAYNMLQKESINKAALTKSKPDTENLGEKSVILG